MTQSLFKTLLLSPGSWCAQGFICALQESVSPVLWKFCNQIPLAFKSNSMEFSVLLPHPQVWKSVVGSRTFVTVRELLWYNCSAVCGPSAQWLNDGDNGNLLQEDLCYTTHTHIIFPYTATCIPPKFIQCYLYSSLIYTYSSLIPQTHGIRRWSLWEVVGS